MRGSGDSQDRMEDVVLGLDRAGPVGASILRPDRVIGEPATTVGVDWARGETMALVKLVWVGGET